jgi:hypothetical protein
VVLDRSRDLAHWLCATSSEVAAPEHELVKRSADVEVVSPATSEEEIGNVQSGSGRQIAKNTQVTRLSAFGRKRI